MKYISTDELGTISLKDAHITEIKLDKDNGKLTMAVEGAVVKDGNSQNDFFADKYTDTMQIRFMNLIIEAILLEGHKYYDANEKLIEEVPDVPVSEHDYEKVINSFRDCYIFYGGIPKENAQDNSKCCYQMIIDVEEDSYVVSLYYDKVIAEWEHFLNKANQM